MPDKQFREGDRVRVEYRNESGSFVGEGDFVDSYVGFKGCKFFEGVVIKEAHDMCHVETVIGMLTVPLKNVSPVARENGISKDIEREGEV